MSDHRFVTDVPELVRPRLIVMLTGWIDASGAAAAAMSALESELDARPLVHFDDDMFIDYRARRPILEVRSGVSTRLVWSSPELLLGRDSNGGDVLLLSGPEPDMAWHRFTRHGRLPGRAIWGAIDDRPRRLPVRHAAHTTTRGVVDVTVARPDCPARVPGELRRRSGRRRRRSGTGDARARHPGRRAVGPGAPLRRGDELPGGVRRPARRR